MSAVATINQHFKIADKDQYVISKIIQRLQIKDLDAEYFAGEIASQLNIDKSNALAITAEIKRIILSPLRKELSDYGIDITLLDKFQMPLIKPKVLSEVRSPASVASTTSTAASTAPAAPAGPKIISETFEATATGAPKIVAAGMPPKAPTPPAAPQPKLQAVTSQTAAGLSVSTSSLVPNKNFAASTPQAPKLRMDKGWSKEAPQDPVVKLGVITPSIPVPGNSTAVSKNMPSAQPTGQAQGGQSPAFTPKTMSEFERLDMMKKSTAAVPPPVMLHEISKPATIQQSSDFHIATGMQNQINKTTVPPPMPVKSAVIEFGGAPAPKVVHYTQYQATATPPPTIGMTGPRNVTEISAMPAAAPMPPRPTPPMPSKPSAQQDAKVIVKDFLGPQK